MNPKIAKILLIVSSKRSSGITEESRLTNMGQRRGEDKKLVGSAKASSGTGKTWNDSF